jgi:hypothetical protein
MSDIDCKNLDYILKQGQNTMSGTGIHSYAVQQTRMP